MAESQNAPTSIIIGPALFSYARLLKPGKMQNDANSQEKYSVSLVFPKSDKNLKAKIDAAVDAALKAKFGTGKVPKGIKMPLRDGDTERDDPHYEKCWFVNATSNTKPGIVDAKGVRMLDPTDEEIYSGITGRASVNFYYSSKGGDKICCGLNNVQKLRDGENLTGRRDAEEEFADGFVFEDDDV